MADKKFSKYLYLNKGYKKNGEEKVQGAIKLFLKKPYNSLQVYPGVRTVAVGNKQHTVGSVEGSVKVDGFLKSQIEYAFNTEVEENSYLQIKVSLWDKKAEALEKFNLDERDLLLFFVSNIELNSFSKKDGSTGYALTATAYDFEMLRKAPSAAQSDSSAKAPVHQEPDSDYDMDAVNESDDFDFADNGDLPF